MFSIDDLAVGELSAWQVLELLNCELAPQFDAKKADVSPKDYRVFLKDSLRIMGCLFKIWQIAMRQGVLIFG